MSENQQEKDQSAEQNDTGDDLTPPDLQPGEDNPLAEPLDEDEALDDLDVLGGKTPEETDDDDQGAEEETGSEEE